MAIVYQILTGIFQNCRVFFGGECYALEKMFTAWN